MLYKLCLRDRYGMWSEWGTHFRTISEAIEMGETLVQHTDYDLQYKVRRAF